MYKCEMCGAVSETEMKCTGCNVDMKKVETTSTTPNTEEPKA